MKSIIRIFGILLVMSLFPVVFPTQASAQGPYISYQVFYDQLGPYGQWVDYPRYGYVWIPDAGPDFFPYSSGGYWIMTEYGWTWQSDYSWGWAPFHYGRWDYDNNYGWFWVPDNIWGPAWVNWIRAPGYYGWTPMGPGMNYGSDYNMYNNQWIFVRDRYFGRNDINRYYANHNDHDMLLRNSTVINNTYVDNNRHITYVSGPARTDVQGVTGRRVSSYAIHENNVPGQSLSKRQLRIYRPQVKENNDNEQHAAPSRVATLQDVKRPSERISPDKQENINTNGSARQIQKQDVVNRQNAVEQQKAVDQQNAVNQQKAIDRQNAVEQQKAVDQQNAVNQQNTRNNERAMQRQNVKRTNNGRKGR
jgi:hypothetical protein